MPKSGTNSGKSAWGKYGQTNNCANGTASGASNVGCGVKSNQYQLYNQTAQNGAGSAKRTPTQTLVVGNCYTGSICTWGAPMQGDGKGCSPCTCTAAGLGDITFSCGCASNSTIAAP